MSDKRNPAIIFIFITMLIDVLGIGIIIPILPDLIEEFVGGGTSNAAIYGSMLMASYAVMQFIMSPIIGGLSDQYGRRPIILASLIGFSIDYLLLAFAPNITWLFVGRLIAGVTGASFTTAGAYIADISKPEERAKNFGMIGAAFGLGFILGPVVGGVLGEINIKLPFFASAGLTAINWLYGYFILPESLSKENRRPFNWKRSNPIGTLSNMTKYPLLFGLSLALFCIQLAGQTNPSTWAYYTKLVFHWSKREIGLSLGFAGVAVAIVQGFLSRKIIPKLGEKNSIFVGLAFWSVGFLLYSFAWKGWMMYVIMMPFAMGGIAAPAIQSVMTQQVGANEQGELQGGITSILSITSILGPLIASNLFSYFASSKAPIYYPGAAFLSGAILAVISLIIAYFSFSKKKEQPSVSK
ncbi:MAG: TCR/Tet family MFS transporter [Flectobacillus sp.]|uniref:TCR/Tet family MFS transporter n=1 Tax=Flectobacillus sp. TaxID=50419 RepID=UPI003B9DBFDD